MYLIYIWATDGIFHPNFNALCAVYRVKASTKHTRTNQNWKGFLYNKLVKIYFLNNLHLRGHYYQKNWIKHENSRSKHKILQHCNQANPSLHS